MGRFGADLLSGAPRFFGPGVLIGLFGLAPPLTCVTVGPSLGPVFFSFARVSTADGCDSLVLFGNLFPDEASITWLCRFGASYCRPPPPIVPPSSLEGQVPILGSLTSLPAVLSAGVSLVDVASECSLEPDVYLEAKVPSALGSDDAPPPCFPPCLALEAALDWSDERAPPRKSPRLEGRAGVQVLAVAMARKAALREGPVSGLAIRAQTGPGTPADLNSSFAWKARIKSAKCGILLEDADLRSFLDFLRLASPEV